jgi:hypothetical protein
VFVKIIMCKYTKSKGEFLKNNSNILIEDNLLKCLLSCKEMATIKGLKDQRLYFHVQNAGRKSYMKYVCFIV